MADTAASSPVVAASPKKAGKVKATAASKKPRAKAAHPKTSDMVNNAIKNLKERGGSSLQAIKKYIASNYKVDAEKLAPFIKKYIKGAVTSGALVQTKGKGASGSFKLASKEKVEKKAPAKPKAAAPAKKKIAAPAKEKKPKAPAAKKSPAAKKAVATKKPKSPSKAKKAAKAPPAAKKPKPKKAVAKPKAAPKKTAAKKK